MLAGAPMLTEQEFSDLSGKIADQAFPDARKFWTSNRRHLVTELYRSDRQGLPQIESGDFRFDGGVLLGLQLAGSAAQLVSAIVAIYVVLKRKPSAGSSTDDLVKLLAQGGTAADKIAKIVELVSKAVPK
jgi:hypothetical protein